MPIYRVLKDLSFGEKVVNAGAFLPHTRFKPENIAILEERGAIARINPPPLHIIPGWSTRAAKLNKAGIQNAEQFLEGDINTLAESAGVSVETVAKWQTELSTHWLNTPDNGCGCS